MSEAAVIDGSARWALHQGDCLEGLATVNAGTLDLVVCDPPYSINTKSDGFGKLSPWADACNAAFWYAAWMREVRRALRQDGAMWCFLSWRSLVTFQKASCDIGWPIESMLVWDKEWIGPGGSRGLRPSYELVALFAMPDFALKDRGLPDIRRCPWSSSKPNGHPAEKPIDLVRWLVEKSLPGRRGLVADPFSGSGTTGAAAVSLGHRFVGWEIDESWAVSARDRIACSAAQSALFATREEVA